MPNTAAQIVSSGRRNWLRMADARPWADQLIVAFDRLHTLPLRA